MHGFVKPSVSILELWKVQKGCCFHCDKPMILSRADGMEKDLMATREHVYPRETTGQRAKLLNNIVLAHSICNNRRGCKLPTHEQITKAKAIYMLMGLTAFIPFREWDREALFPKPEGPKLCDVWPK
jgi:hypothetical protein